MRRREAKLVVTERDLDKFHEKGYRVLYTPYDLSYKSKWDDIWYVFREFWQNAADEEDLIESSRLPKIRYVNAGVTIEDRGRGVGAEALLLREVKASNPDLRGEFGEGLKWACICALRLGYDLCISSPKAEIIPRIFPTTFGSTEVRQVVFLWRNKDRVGKGTKVRIYGYQDELFTDRFFPNLCKDQSFEHLRDCVVHSPMMQNRLYVKDIYVRNLGSDSEDKKSRFVYNLWGVELDPDRVQVTSDWDLRYEVGRIWTLCDDVSMAKEFLLAVTEQEWESGVIIGSHLSMNSEVWTEAWQEAFGPNAVIHTEHTLSNHAVDIGRKPIEHIPATVRMALSEAGVPSDRKVIEERNTRVRENRVVIPDSALDTMRMNNLRVLRWVASGIGDYCSDLPINWKEIKIVAAYIPEVAGRSFLGVASGDTVYMSVGSLDSFFNPRGALRVLCHELAHLTEDAKGLPDGYQPHLKAEETIFTAVARFMYYSRSQEEWNRVNNAEDVVNA